jgi:hypothetical protein
MNTMATMSRFRARVVVTAFALQWAVAGQVGAEVVEVAYSFNGDQGGGVAVVSVDPQTGKMVGHRELFRASDCTAANKVRRSSDRRTILVNNETPKGPHLYLASAQGGLPVPIELSDEPDEVRIAGRHALVTCADDSLALIDVVGGRRAGRWEADEELDPPGNAPEDATVLPDGKTAVVSFQKDSGKGKKLGSRLVVMQLPELKPLADLRLPRNHEELHIEGNKKEQGPSPEIVLVCASANTLMVTLDLYGAVALMDWSEARAGRLSNWKYLSTALDGSWGSAFPDRAGLISVGARPCALVFNAGPAGGAVLVDLAGRKIVRRWPVPPGLEKPVYFSEFRKAYSVCSGKIKSRGEKELKKDYDPGRSVYAFDFGPTRQGRPDRLQELPLERFVIRLAPVEGADRPMLLLAAGEDDDKTDTILVYDPDRRAVLDQRPAAGTIGQFEG